MNSNDLCKMIVNNLDSVRQRTDAELDQASAVNPSKSLRRLCIEGFWWGTIYLDTRAIVTGIRRELLRDREFAVRLNQALGVVRANMERFLFRNQGYNDLIKWMTAAAFLGRNGIEFAPPEERLLTGFAFATLAAWQNVQTVESDRRGRLRRAGLRPRLCMDDIPLVDGNNTNAITIQQVGLLLPLCVDRRIHIAFAKSVVDDNEQAMHRFTRMALDQSLPRLATHEQVRRGFDALARDVNCRTRFIADTREKFHWPAMVAYRAIEPFVRYISRN